jgi:uncharacterized membrane protein
MCKRKRSSYSGNTHWVISAQAHHPRRKTMQHHPDRSELSSSNFDARWYLAPLLLAVTGVALTLLFALMAPERHPTLVEESLATQVEPPPLPPSA